MCGHLNVFKTKYNRRFSSSFRLVIFQGVPAVLGQMKRISMAAESSGASAGCHGGWFGADRTGLECLVKTLDFLLEASRHLS